MPFTIVAHHQNIDEGGVLSNLDALVDATHNVSGDYIYIGEWNNLIGVAAYLGSTAVRARITSPSLRAVIPLDISPVANEIAGTHHDQIHLFPMNPIPLVTTEGLEALSLADPAAPERHTIVSFLSTGAIAPVSGKIVTIRATASISAVVGAWTSGALTFEQTLPAGTYQVVGMRLEGANLVAGRLIGIGVTQRPGVIANADDTSRGHPLFRQGGLGVWFEFNNFTPPSLEILASGANTAQVVYLDLIKIA